MTVLFQTAFPDFALDVAIPEGWQDTSWRNDACPSWIVKAADGAELRVYVDYTDEARRECEGSDRFSVLKENANGDADCVFTSNEWQRVLAFVAAQH